MKRYLSLSILDAKDKEIAIVNAKNIVQKIKKIYGEAYELAIHFDVMDQQFVPNTGINLEWIKVASENGIYADVHFMVKEPMEKIKRAILYGASRITIHYEIENFKQILDYLNTLPVEIGIAIKPGTSVKELELYQGKFSHLLIMSVEPGFGGQKYLSQTNEKIKEAIGRGFSIQVDGGIGFDTMIEPFGLGVCDFVVGSYLTKAMDMETNFICLAIEKEMLECQRNANIEFTKRILQVVENGYAQQDILLGIRTPDVRKIAKKWYKYLSLEGISQFLSSPIHEFRQLAIFCLINQSNKDENSYQFLKIHIENINNWDLTDIAGPNLFAKFLMKQDEKFARKEIQDLMNDENLWTKRIGIVILLEYARRGELSFVFEMILPVLYEEYHLFQKASGWVLREAYKMDKETTFEFLYNCQKEKRLPRILVSYACEKMSKEEKEKIRGIK